MNWVGMGEGRRPQPAAPLRREHLGQFLASKSEALRRCISIDQLQVPELVQKHVIKHESANCQCWPLLATFGSELLRGLAFRESSLQAHAGRQSTESDFPSSRVDIAESACTTAPIIEVDGAHAMPHFDGKTAQDDTHVLRVYVVDSVGTWRKRRKPDGQV
jgi:hypothetical protein